MKNKRTGNYRLCGFVDRIAKATGEKYPHHVDKFRLTKQQAEIYIQRINKHNILNTLRIEEL